MAKETNLETIRKKEKDIAIAFLILSLAFLFTMYFKTDLNNQYTQELLRLGSKLNSISNISILP